ncbi:hypothetical protein H6G80_04015 [Nostoc sp. FACHB-87]|uniref:hypothetical protein n=1 Tax=Nostocaceae TaxID=1162 RepID=UPI001684FEDC|nr:MULTISPECIES: hypothetical protein [Nostocaceae]MBD2453240.1 hypothetical protein [Nostoc sp. FACHB-87]MBD2474980.1 hypothetical protein [Anabaena sp. FACHB-83]
MLTYSEIKTKYPLLVDRLICWAANRIAGTSEHIERETRGKISRLLYQRNQLSLSLPCFRAGISVKDFKNQALSNEEYRHLESEILAAEFTLKSIKHNDVKPSPAQWMQAENEVRDYVEALQYPNDEIFRVWGDRLSGREKHHIRKISDFLQKETAYPNKIWEWIDNADSWYDLHEYQILSEPVINSFFDSDRQLYAYISINAYNVYCLNSLNVMFVDIDIDPTIDDPGISSLCYPWEKFKVEESEILTAIASTAKAYDLKFHCYRTHSGLRLLEMTRPWEATHPDTISVMEAMGCDRLYQRLCQTQNTFRARLEPKPWRGDDGDAVCHYLRSFGQGIDHPLAVRIKAIHDDWCVKSNAPLA